MKTRYPALVFSRNNDDVNDLIEPYLSKNSLCKSCDVGNCHACTAILLPPRPWYDYELSTRHMLPLKSGKRAIQTFVDKVNWGPTGDEFDAACNEMVKHFKDVVDEKVHDLEVSFWIEDTGLDPKMDWVATKYAMYHVNFHQWLYITPDGDFHGIKGNEDMFNYNISAYDYARNFKTDVVDKFGPSTHVTAIMLVDKN